MIELDKILQVVSLLLETAHTNVANITANMLSATFEACLQAMKYHFPKFSLTQSSPRRQIYVCPKFCKLLRD